MAERGERFARSTEGNITGVGPFEETDNTGVIIGSTVGGLVFLALLITAIVLLVRRYGRTERRLKRAMKSSLKDAEKHGSLQPVNRQPAFANPHTRVLDTLKLESTGVEKPKTKTIGAYYSASNEAVELREVDVSVYEDRMLNLALAKGHSSKRKQGAGQNDANDWTDKKASWKEEDQASGDVPQAENYAYVGPLGTLEMISSGLPDERAPTIQVDLPKDNVANSHGSPQENRASPPADNTSRLEGISSETVSNINPAFVRDEVDEMNNAGLSNKPNKSAYESLHPDDSEQTIQTDLEKGAGSTIEVHLRTRFQDQKS